MRLTFGSEKERGDTIIEVIIAITIFSLVAVGSFTIMNQGIAASERALEITLVRQQINAQAEALRFMHSSRASTAPSANVVNTWRRLTTEFRQSSASPYGTTSNECTISGSRPFVLNARTAQIWSGSLTASASSASVPPYSQVIYNTDSSISAAYGIWIESVPSGAPVAKPFVDFHIRACWAASGSLRPMTIGTIVRLYDPAN